VRPPARHPGLFERIGPDCCVYPVGPIRGDAWLPGSKSLTNRYLTCAALADGRTVLRGATIPDDVERMIAGLRALGIRVAADPSRAEISVDGCRGFLPAQAADIDAGAAGTAMRFLTALACLGHGRYRLDGSERMRARPIAGLVGALQQLGAGIGCEIREGYPPLNVVASGLRGGEVVFDRPPSSQFVSALLMVAPYGRQDVLVRIEGGLVSRPYVDMTIDVMRAFGVDALCDDQARRFVIPAYQRYVGGEFEIEPDASAATYFWAAAAVTGGRVRAPGLTRASRQGDARFVDVLAQMGCTVTEEGGLTVAAPSSGPLTGVSVDLNAMPDAVQTLAVAALFARGPTEIRNVANLRIKETDRLAALATELRRLGAAVEEFADGLQIKPPERIAPARIATYDDHRMAMSFALAGLRTDGIVIADAACVSKSFPGYFESLASLAWPR
jgi:3-phosphoshikimate 1-carboxyvinyltransferase